MSVTPRSRTPSRVGTPVSGLSPSRLVIPPPLRPTHSLSSLQVYSRGSTPSAPDSPVASHVSRPALPPNESSSLSVADTDVNSGILFPETEVDVDTVGEESNAIGRVAGPAGDAVSKKNLRDHLRQTLNKRQSIPDMTIRPARRKPKTLNELSHEQVDLFPPRQYFVLTEAGKPVFTSRPASADSNDLASAIGIMQALISVFLDDNDKLRCINAGSARITFLLRPPLYYVCSSSWGEPESVTRNHLEYLHLQILSIVTAAHLRRIFERRRNSDLGRLLSGAENILHSLLNRLDWDLALSTSSLHCLKLDPTLRARAAESLVPPSKTKDILYVILVANGRVVSLIRPKKHSIHPADIHVLVNTIHAPSIMNSPASVSWLPICLPKFNPSGFVNAYVNFLVKGDDEPKQTETDAGGGQTNELQGGEAGENSEHAVSEADISPTSTSPSTNERRSLEIGLVCISGGPDFETIRAWCDSVVKKLRTDGTLDALVDAVRTRSTEYSVSELGIPGLRHFVYKSRSHVQITVPLFEDPYDDVNERHRLVTLYQTLHDAIHAKSGQGGNLKLQYIRTEKESVMGWITQPFELYVALSPRLPKSAVVGAANAVARWVKREESRLFLTNAPVF